MLVIVPGEQRYVTLNNKVKLIILLLIRLYSILLRHLSTLTRRFVLDLVMLWDN